MNIDFTPSNNLSLFFFLGVVTSVLIMIAVGSYNINRKFAFQFLLFLGGWISIMSLVVTSNILYTYTLPALPIFFLTINLCAISVGISSWGKRFASLPIWMLIVFHAFRLPLEIVLHLWSDQGTVPQTMTWTGQNLDIISGALALGALYPWKNITRFAWFFNTVGILLLINVLRVVVMSSGLPFSWDLTKPLMLALFMPYALITIVCVWAALTGHIVLTRSLLSKNKSSNSSNPS